MQVEHDVLRTQGIHAVNDHLTGKLVIVELTDPCGCVESVEVAYGSPPVEERVAPIDFAQVVIEVDQVPRRSALQETNELVVRVGVGNFVTCVGDLEIVVSDLLIIEDQDSHEITPHSFGPIV